jgi:hypothetical protein
VNEGKVIRQNMQQISRKKLGKQPDCKTLQANEDSGTFILFRLTLMQELRPHLKRKIKNQ